MTSLLMALTLLAEIPRSDVLIDSVDLVELNHFYDEHGRLVFDQVIFYDWQDFTRQVASPATPMERGAETPPPCESGPRYQVRAWRLVKNPNQIPHRDWRQGGYTCGPWQDGEIMRIVRAKSIRETWTQYDPELIEREYLPKEKRKELSVHPKPKKKPDVAPTNPMPLP